MKQSDLLTCFSLIFSPTHTWCLVCYSHHAMQGIPINVIMLFWSLLLHCFILSSWPASSSPVALIYLACFTCGGLTSAAGQRSTNLPRQWRENHDCERLMPNGFPGWPHSTSTAARAKYLEYPVPNLGQQWFNCHPRLAGCEGTVQKSQPRGMRSFALGLHTARTRFV